MNTVRKYLVLAIAAIVLSLTLASVTAQAWCAEVWETEEYACYNFAEDDCYCYYNCFCLVDYSTCEDALRRGGFELME